MDLYKYNKEIKNAIIIATSFDFKQPKIHWTEKKNKKHNSIKLDGIPLEYKPGTKEYKKLANKIRYDFYKSLDPDYLKKVNIKSRTNNFEKNLMYQVKSSAKKRGMEFNLTIEDFIIPEFCPILNIKITRTIGKGRTPFNPSVDRIDNNKGYIKGNIMIVSNKANTMKNNASTDELIAFSNYFLKNLT